MVKPIHNPSTGPLRLVGLMSGSGTNIRKIIDHQKKLALSFGYNDDGHNMAVEQFMQQYYRTVMELDRLNEMLLQHFQEAILYAQEPVTPVPLNSRFQSTRGFIEVTYDEVFKHYPYALLEIFLLLQLHPELKGVRRLCNDGTDHIAYARQYSQMAVDRRPEFHNDSCAVVHA